MILARPSKPTFDFTAVMRFLLASVEATAVVLLFILVLKGVGLRLSESGMLPFMFVTLGSLIFSKNLALYLFDSKKSLTMTVVKLFFGRLGR